MPRRIWRINLVTNVDRRDGLSLLGLGLVASLYAIRFHDFSIHPFEDAAMLMRYAQHLAEGHGVVWNVGERPVDGATDFLFMVLLALLAKAGLSLEFGARVLGYVSHLLSVFIVYLAIRLFHGSNRSLALVSSAYLALGPALGYIAACFGTPFFALCVSLSWFHAIRLSKQSKARRTSILFAFSSLMMGLARPEGVFLAVFMVLGLIYARGWRNSRALVAYFVAIFVVLGGSYFVWRWDYFGQPFPNPFYLKGGGHLYWAGLKESVWNVGSLSFPFPLVFAAAFRTPRVAKQAVFALIPIAGFTAVWVLLSTETNFLMRFQYPILPVILMSWPALLSNIDDDWRLPKLHELNPRARNVLLMVIGSVLVGALVYHPWKLHKFQFHRDGRYDIAVVLREYCQRRYVIATTEAGLLPLYSKWRAVDALGLNDQWIVRHGGITPSYLDSYKPHVIMFHAYFSPVVYAPGVGSYSSTVTTIKAYAERTATALKAYAERNDYRLAAAFGESPYDTHYYYVRPDFPESAEIVRRIRQTGYFWFDTGSKCVNYQEFSSAHSP